MSLKPKDPLLTAAKMLLTIAMIVFAVAASACLIAMPLIWLFQGKISAEIAQEVANYDVVTLLWPLSALLVVTAVLMVIGFFFVKLLKQIVETVGEGDPFVPVNATRLTRMGWLTLAVQVLTVPLAAAGMWAFKVTEPIRDNDGETLVIDHGLDFGGLILMLTLFILARVFREGARMRADLEGTV